jgi:signal transduction histidine kinase
MNSAYLDQLRACCRDQAAFEQMQQILAVAQTQQQSQALAEALDRLSKSQAQLIQSEKLSHLGQLVAGIAHEINNPVNFICGNLTHANRYAQQLIELLALYRQEHPSPSPALQRRLEELDLDFILEDFPKLLGSMQMGGDRIRQIVLSLRGFSRPDAPEMQPTNLHEGIDNTLLILHHRLKPRSNFRGIHVVCEYGKVPLVECYPNQINQVFMNLISNAIDALEEMNVAEQDDTIQAQPSRPQITIRTLQIPDPQGGNPRVIICIADNGNGIPLEIQARLFEPFFTTKAIGKGTGLGLSISRDIIVNTHGGDLQCYSEPGKGSEFWIELPVKQASISAEHDATQNAMSSANKWARSQSSEIRSSEIRSSEIQSSEIPASNALVWEAWNFG